MIIIDQNDDLMRWGCKIYKTHVSLYEANVTLAEAPLTVRIRWTAKATKVSAKEKLHEREMDDVPNLE